MEIERCSDCTLTQELRCHHQADRLYILAVSEANAGGCYLDGGSVRDARRATAAVEACRYHQRNIDAFRAMQRYHDLATNPANQPAPPPDPAAAEIVRNLRRERLGIPFTPQDWQ